MTLKSGRETIKRNNYTFKYTTFFVSQLLKRENEVIFGADIFQIHVY
jgi:hypothetical protein